jgi:hypothetical protein
VLGLHQTIAQTIVLYYAVVGAWGVVLAVRKAELNAAFRGALAIGIGLGVVQAIVGLVLLAMGLRPADNLHFLYGASVILTVPLVASYVVDKKFSRPLAYGLAFIFMAGLGLRAFATGSPGQ